MEKVYNRECADAVNEFFSSMGWRHNYDKENGQITLSICTKDKSYHTQEIITFRESFYTVSILLPMTVDMNDQKVIIAVYDYINRINSKLNNGHFELDLNGGQIWFRSCFSCRDFIPPKLAILESIQCALYNLEMSIPGFTDVISGKATPEEAIAACRDETAEEEMDASWKNAYESKIKPKAGEKAEKDIIEANDRLAKRFGTHSEDSKPTDTDTAPKNFKTNLFGA